MWPAASVNSRIPPILLVDADGSPILDEKGKDQWVAANKWLDAHRSVNWARMPSMDELRQVLELWHHQEFEYESAHYIRGVYWIGDGQSVDGPFDEPGPPAAVVAKLPKRARDVLLALNGWMTFNEIKEAVEGKPNWVLLGGPDRGRKPARWQVDQWLVRALAQLFEAGVIEDGYPDDDACSKHYRVCGTPKTTTPTTTPLPAAPPAKSAPAPSSLPRPAGICVAPAAALPDDDEAPPF
jgi:hypothetical protein